MKNAKISFRLFMAVIAALLGVIAIGSKGCFLYYDLDDDGEFAIGYRGSDAFISRCYVSVTDTVVEIPTSYNGAKITSLGGYMGRGFPCPFAISLKGEFDWIGSGEDDDDYETLTFTVKMGANIEKLTYVSGKDFYGVHVEKEDGTILSDALYKVCYYFEVDPNNEYFYSLGGKLYDKKTNELIDEFYYE